MDLKGKTVLFLGDSITEGAGCSEPRYFYWNQFAEKTGAICKGYGIGGTRIARQQQSPQDENQRIWNRYFRSRLPEMDDHADAVVVFGGTNDFGHGDAPLGRFEDRTDDSFYGALHLLYSDLLVKYPTAQIVVMTPTHRLSERTVGFNECGLRQDHPLKDYVEAIREVAEYYSLPVLDLFRVSGIQPAVPIMKETYMPDGLHPSDAGAARIADKLVGFFKTL